MLIWNGLEIQQQSELKLYDALVDLADALHEYAKDLGEVRTWTLVENNLAIYAVAKQNKLVNYF